MEKMVIRVTEFELAIKAHETLTKTETARFLAWLSASKIPWVGGIPEPMPKIVLQQILTLLIARRKHIHSIRIYYLDHGRVMEITIFHSDTPKEKTQEEYEEALNRLLEA